MSFTRFHNDPARTKKQLEMMTRVGWYGINVPGNGPKPAYIADPYVRMQRWGANLRTNCINVDSYLRGLDETTNHYTENPKPPPSESIKYPVIGQVTHQPRATNPAWELRGLQGQRLSYLFEDPQEHLERKFACNLNSRLIERDRFNAGVCMPNIRN